MVHSHHFEENSSFWQGYFVAEILARLSALEGTVADMSQAWDDQSTRFANDVTALKQKFDGLNSQIQDLVTQVQNAPNVDSAKAEQAAADAAQISTALDSFEAAFGLSGTGQPDPGSGETPPATDPGTGTTDPGTTDPGTTDPGTGATDPATPPDPGTPTDPTTGGGPTDLPPGPSDPGTPTDPGAGGTVDPGTPTTDPGTDPGTAPDPSTPTPPATDPNDPNAAQPTPAPDSPDAGPTSPVSGG